MQVPESEMMTALVVQSLQHQEEMQSLLGELQQQLARGSNSPTNSIENFNKQFSTLQVKMQQTDMQLTTQLRESDIPDTTRQLLARRHTLQEHNVQLLKAAVPKARSVTSLLASEMQSLKAGRRALSGYKNMSDRQGSIINRKR